MSIEAKLSKTINELWNQHTVGNSTEEIDRLQDQLTAIRTEKAEPTELPNNWCESDGQWWT